MPDSANISYILDANVSLQVRQLSVENPKLLALSRWVIECILKVQPFGRMHQN